VTAKSTTAEHQHLGLARLWLPILVAGLTLSGLAADAPAPAVPAAPEPTVPDVLATPAPADPAADPAVPAAAVTVELPQPAILLNPQAASASGDVAGNALQARAAVALEKVQDGQALLDEGQKDAGRKLLGEAVKELESVFHADPSMTSVWSTLGWCYWLLDRPAEAESFWLLLVGLDPGNARAFELLGSAKMARKDLAGAAKDLERAAQLDPAAVSAVMKLGSVYRWLGRYPDSVAVLRRVCRENPARMDAQDELAMSLFFNGNYVEAAPLLAAARARKPDMPELVLYESRARLESGDVDASEKIADEVLASHPTNVPALLLRSETRLIADRLPEAAADLEQAMANAADPQAKTEAARPLVRIRKLLWQQTKDAKELDRAITISEEMIQAFPDDADWRLLDAELSLLGKYHDRAMGGFRYVLDHVNTNSVRALMGLFDAEIGRGHMGAASEWNDRLRALNPLDCYHHDRQVRFELAWGNMRVAYEHALRLEEAGASGAVAILTYRGLRKAGRIDGIAEAKFLAHVKALRAAGYRFIKIGDVAEELRQTDARGRNLRELEPDRVVAICIDQPSEESLRIAETISQSLRVPMSMFLTTSGLARESPATGPGAELVKELIATGRWGVAVVPGQGEAKAVDGEGRTVHALANRIVRPDGRLETQEEFAERVRQTYAEAHQAMQDAFPGLRADVCAYPYGNLGQGGRSNDRTAVESNLAAARGLFAFGVVPSVFGHAVRGSDPLWQHTMLPDPEWSGEVLVRTVLEHHPLHLARRLYAQTAVLDARYYRTKDTLKTLADTHYPEAGVKSATAFMRDRIAVEGSARVTGLAIDREQERGRVNAEALLPTVGADVAIRQTSIEDDNVNYGVLGSIKPLRFLRVEGRAGAGSWEQDLVSDRLAARDANQNPITRYAVDTTDFGLEGNLMLLPGGADWNPLELRLEWLHREFTGDAEWSVDRTVGELGIRPVLPIYMTLRLEHDVVPSARSVVENTTYDLVGGEVFAELQDGWLLNGGVKQYSISDDNERQHLTLRSIVEIWQDGGLWLGGQVGTVDAEHYRDEYWTPSKYTEYGLVVEWKRRFPLVTFDIWAMVGQSRERARPEDIAAYEQLRQQAILQRWSDRLAPLEDGEWEPLFAGYGLCMFNLTRRLEGWIQAGYTETSSYDEFNLAAGLYFKFY
jgi:tetratricopeptide (TPR) repeat protein